MDDKLKEALHYEVNKLFSEDVEKHRLYIQWQFKQLKWSVAILLAIALTAFYFFTGRTMSNVEEYARGQVTDTVIKYFVKDEVKSETQEQIELAVLDQVNSENTYNIISDNINTVISTRIANEANKVFDKILAVQIENMKNITKSDLVPRGSILPWFNSGEVPPGWVLCNGENGTPNLSGKYLIGLDYNAEIGDAVGAINHDHMIELYTDKPSDTQASFLTPSKDHGEDVNGFDHKHVIKGLTKVSRNLPPSIYVNFIMKT